MELREVFQVIWKRLWLIVLGTLLVSAVAFMASKSMTPIYQAKVTMMVKQSANAPFADLKVFASGENLALTYSKLLKTRPLLETVIANLNLDLSPERLAKDKLGTRLVSETQLLVLTAKDPDPQRAADIANEIAFTFISSHNAKQQLQDIVALEQDVVSQMANLKKLIEHNQLAVDSARTSPGRLSEEESRLLQANLSSQQSAYASLSAAYLNIRLTQGQLLDISVVEPAVAPKAPVEPNVFLYTFLGAFLGLNLGAGLAFLLEYLDRSLKTGDDVRQTLSLPTLGTIPRLRRKERSIRLVASTLPRAPISEAFRTLRTNIRFASVDEPLRTLLITSAEPGAGKTTIAANLGAVCAQAGLQVMLIDTDLRRPRVHQLFNLNNHNGLTDLLIGNVQSVEECMVGTETDNLRLITSGPTPPNPSELLGSKRMEAVLAQAQKNAELVILDTTPTLAVTDAAVLAKGVDGVLLVVNAGKTWREVAQHALESLRQVGANVVGVVLNAVPTQRGSYYHYYHHEYDQDDGGSRKHSLRRLARRLATGRRPFG